MNLFLENGHLTDEGLQGLLDGSLDEMQRLEVSEHLSFCDECLVRYTNLLTDPVCIEPPQDLTLPIMKRLRKKIFYVVTSRYATAAAAVVLTLCLWLAGVFSGIQDKSIPQGSQPSQTTFSDGMKQVFWKISGAFSEIMYEVSGGISSTMQKENQGNQADLAQQPEPAQ